MPSHDVSHELTVSHVSLRTSAEVVEVILCLVIGGILARRVCVSNACFDAEGCMMYKTNIKSMLKLMYKTHIKSILKNMYNNT